MLLWRDVMMPHSGFATWKLEILSQLCTKNPTTALLRSRTLLQSRLNSSFEAKLTVCSLKRRVILIRSLKSDKVTSFRMLQEGALFKLPLFRENKNASFFLNLSTKTLIWVCFLTKYQSLFLIFRPCPLEEKSRPSSWIWNRLWWARPRNCFTIRAIKEGRITRQSHNPYWLWKITWRPSSILPYISSNVKTIFFNMQTTTLQMKTLKIFKFWDKWP